MNPYKLPFDPIQLPIIGHLGGSVSGIAIRGSIAFLGVGSEFAILDVSNTKHIKQIGSIVLDGVIQEVCLDGTYAYVTVAEGADGLYVLDVSQPQEPVQLGYYPLVWARFVVMVGQYAYVAATESELHIVDVADPRRPALSGKLTLQRIDERYPRVWALAVAGRNAYIAAADLNIYDVSDPLAPSFIGSFPIGQGDGVQAVRIREPYAYLGTSNQGLVILDITDPALPKLISSYGSYETQGFTNEIELAGNYVYLISSFEFDEGFFQVLDVSIPARPSLVRRDPQLGRSLVIAHGLAFVSAMQGGLRILDISNPEAPVPFGRWLAPGVVDSVALTNKLAYINGGWEGFHVADLSRPESPMAIASFQSRNCIRQIVAHGQRAYLVEGACTFDGCSGGLRIVDVSDPRSPAELGYWGEADGEAEDALLLDSVLCLYWAKPANDGTDKMIHTARLLDVSEPREIRELATHPLLEGGLDVRVSGRLVHLDASYIRRRGLPVSTEGITYVPATRRGLYVCRSQLFDA